VHLSSDIVDDDIEDDGFLNISSQKGHIRFYLSSFFSSGTYRFSFLKKI